MLSSNPDCITRTCVLPSRGAQATSSAIGPIGSVSGGSQKASVTTNPSDRSNCRTVPRKTPPSRPRISSRKSVGAHSNAYGPNARGVVTECATCHHAPSASASKNAFSTRWAGAAMTIETSRWGAGMGCPPEARILALVVHWLPMSQPMAYQNPEFLESSEGRPVRILSEYLEPLRRFKEQRIQDTVVFFGSARVDSRERAERAFRTLKARGEHD